ncbi:MAG: alcohol dehydrogenase catalytic domain-containing protein [Promethearchaeota archaeon]
MRVAMYYNNNDVRFEEMPKPKINPGEILVKVMASGICGSDVMEWYRIKKAPRVLGHEISGEIVEIGDGVTGYRVGDRVFVSHHVPCNTCRYCLFGHHTACETLHTTNFDPGGNSEYIRVPQINVDRGVFALPEEVSFEEAVFVEPLACAVRGQRLIDVKPGQTVLVIGCGISGLLHLQLAHALGATRVAASCKYPFQLEAARKFGADIVIDAKEDVSHTLRKANDGRLADAAIVCAGSSSAARTALESVDRGGTILFFAVPPPDVEFPINLNEIWRNEITLKTSYAASPLDILQSIELIRSRNVRVREMVTHRLSLEEAGLGFKLMAKKTEGVIKVILKPHG